MFTQKVGSGSARQERQKLLQVFEFKFILTSPLWLTHMQVPKIPKVVSFNTKILNVLTEKQRQHYKHYSVWKLKSDNS